MQEDEEKQENVNGSEWKKVPGSRMVTYKLDDEPMIVHFIRMHYEEPTYHVCREDAFGMWPWTDGLGKNFQVKDCVMTKIQVKGHFGIELDI